MSPPGGVKVKRSETGVGEQRDGMRADGGREVEDLSVPMWVWTLLGFALVVAVIIVVIISGGGQARQNDQAPGGAASETVNPAPATP
jgi:hypothetical protein